MNLNKIDKRLLSEIAVLSRQKRVPCFVFSSTPAQTKRLLNAKNIHILNEYLFINSFHCLLSMSEISALSTVACVGYISSVATATSLMHASKKILNANAAVLSGQGVGVAFIDTGICPHCDFMLGQNRIKFFKDFVAGKDQVYDDNGHGTFVCGVCSGNGYLSKFKRSGVAPKSNIFSLKALDTKGEASANKILDAMEWIYKNHKNKGIDVVCLSFGSEPLGSRDPIMLGAEALWQEGLVVVAAAGNSGPEYQTIKSPGVSPKIITVGGIDDNRYDEENFDRKYFEIADFSSRGPAFRKIKPDVVAPSVDIISCGKNDFYTILSGTSVAAPMVAGLCCLLKEKDKSLSPDKIKSILLASCQPLGFERNAEGFGLPNFEKIVGAK